MPDWIFWVAFGWLMFALMGSRGAGCGARRGRRDGLARGSHGRDAVPEPVPAELPPRRQPVAELEWRLRARYVAGELSVDDYERELDRLYRRG